MRDNPARLEGQIFQDLYSVGVSFTSSPLMATMRRERSTTSSSKVSTGSSSVPATWRNATLIRLKVLPC